MPTRFIREGGVCRTAKSERFFEEDADSVTHVFSEGTADFGFDRQFVPAVPERLERALKWKSVDGAAHFDQTARAEEPD
jgi:hypothetical protein